MWGDTAALSDPPQLQCCDPASPLQCPSGLSDANTRSHTARSAPGHGCWRRQSSFVYCYSVMHERKARNRLQRL